MMPRTSLLEGVVQYVSSTLVSNSTKLKQIIYLLASKANSKVEKDWDDYTIWEEVKSIDELMVTKVDQDNTCSQEQISTGDILIIQENLSEVPPAPCAHPFCPHRTPCEPSLFSQSQPPVFQGLPWIGGIQEVMVVLNQDDREDFNLNLQCGKSYCWPCNMYGRKFSIMLT